MKSIRQFFYDMTFGDKGLPTSSSNIFRKFLENLPEGSSVLDVGVGTGVYFCDEDCADLIKKKKIRIHGIDINKKDIRTAKKNLTKRDLSAFVRVEFKNLFDIQQFELYDIVLFSESYPVIEPGLMIAMLRHTVKKRGFKKTVAFLNSIERPVSPANRFLKPLLKYAFFGIDFGRVVTFADMRSTLTAGGLTDIKFEFLATSTINYAFFRELIKVPGWGFPINEYLITARCN